MPQLSVLHLIDGRPDTEPVPTTLALLAMSRCASGSDDRVLLFGGTAVERTARAAGLDGAQCLGVPFGSATLGYASVRRVLSGLGPFDLVHCWSPGALRLAGRALSHLPAALTVTRALSPREQSALARTVRGRRAPTRVALIDPTWKPSLIGAGLRRELCGDVSPAFDPDRCVTDRAAVRARWGVDDEVTVVGLIDPPPFHADAMRVALGIGLPGMRFEAPRGPAPRPLFRLLTHPGQRRRAQARRLVGGFGSPCFLRQDAGLSAPWTVLAGFDVLVVTGGGGAALPWAMAAGVPIIADPEGLAGEVLQHDHNALLAGGDGHRAIAHQFSRLVADPALARTLANHARADAANRFRPETYRSNLAAIYSAIV